MIHDPAVSRARTVLEIAFWLKVSTKNRTGERLCADVPRTVLFSGGGVIPELKSSASSGVPASIRLK
jgi:hypothetical protein